MPVTTTDTHPDRPRPPHDLLDPGLDLTLRPMRYPQFFDRFRDAIKNTWTVEEVDLHTDLTDLGKLTAAERHLVNRLVAFFATGDTIVANNLVLNLYQHVNAREARLYLSRQLFEEAVHVRFYLNLLDTYLPDDVERAKAFAAVENFPSIRRKAEFCFRWIDSLADLRQLDTAADRRAFLLNLICFAACIEGLFFYGAFAYVYFLRSRGLLHGLESGTNWVFRDESMHMAFALDVVETARREEPELFDDDLAAQVRAMLADAGTARSSSPKTSSARASPDCPWPTCVPTSSTWRTAGWNTSASTRSTDRPIPLPSWSCRTCRSCPISSNAGSPPIRWPSEGHSRSPKTSDNDVLPCHRCHGHFRYGGRSDFGRVDSSEDGPRGGRSR
jgi:ribonucleoside-diphosphate reductase beta chain